MRLVLPYHLLALMLLLMVALNLNCQRIKTIAPLLEHMHPALILLSPDEYPSFSDNGDEEGIKQALRNQIRYFSQLKQPIHYSWDRKTISSAILKATLEKFLQVLESDEDKDLKQLIRTYFDVYQSAGEKGNSTVTFTGYYIPKLKGSLEANEEYNYPIYRLPDDLNIKKHKPDGLKKAVRIENGREYPYYTRKQIDQEGTLRGKGYEIAYLKDPFDCYTLHVQGSGTLILPDDTLLPLHFAGSNYYPYHSLREEMLKDGILSSENASMESIRTYFSEHQDQLQPYLNRNARYTFFKVGEDKIVGSLGVQLIPGRAIATDKTIFPPGSLSYIITTVPSVNSSGKVETNIPWSRFVLNQDEGGAIKGSHRVDIFWGTGTLAETIASHMKQPGKLYYLIVKDNINESSEGQY